MKQFLVPVVMALLLGFSCREPQLLSEIPASHSGVDFQNTLRENEFMNNEQFYNCACKAAKLKGL